MPSSRPCDLCAHFTRCGLEQLACSGFIAWVEDGRHDGSAHTPARQLYVDLFGHDDARERYAVQLARQVQERRAAKLEVMRQAARREGIERRRLVAAGLARPLTTTERRSQQLARRRLRWKIDPLLRERHLLLKRQDAIRRGRQRGAAPAGSEGNRLHQIEGQHRRRQGERDAQGRTMTGPGFRSMRAQLGLTVWDVAREMRVTYSAAKQWQKPTAFPPARAVRWLEAVQAGVIDPIRGRTSKEVPAPCPKERCTAPAASGYSEARPL